MKLGLKIDVATTRGLGKGVPQLLDCLARHQCNATFFFNVGTDHLFGQTWLPGTDLGTHHGDSMRRVIDAGCDAGLQGIDTAAWRARAGAADAAWIERAMTGGIARYQEIFGVAPLAHGAAGWQMNRHALRLTQRLGFHYASDTRGSEPFIPVWNAEIVTCPQLPTTLPTLTELAAGRLTTEQAIERLITLNADAPAAGHIYTARAEVEGTRLAAAFEQVLAGWREAGTDVVSLQDYAANLDFARLPHHVVAPGRIDGFPGTLTLQGAAFLA